MRLFGAGMAVGIILGVLAGLLMAPGKGEETRRRVKEVAHVASDRVTHISFDLHRDRPESGDYIRQSI